LSTIVGVLSGLKALLAILLLVVGIAIAYETFFAEQTEKEIIQVLTSDLNFSHYLF
jgi:hypothetical protein